LIYSKRRNHQKNKPSGSSQIDGCGWLPETKRNVTHPKGREIQVEAVLTNIKT